MIYRSQIDANVYIIFVCRWKIVLQTYVFNVSFQVSHLLWFIFTLITGISNIFMHGFNMSFQVSLLLWFIFTFVAGVSNILIYVWIQCVFSSISSALLYIYIGRKSKCGILWNTQVALCWKTFTSRITNKWHLWVQWNIFSV